MIFVQILVAFCFGLPALFLFCVGCHALVKSLKIANLEVGTEGTRCVSYALTGLGAFMLSALVTVIAALLCRAVA